MRSHHPLENEPSKRYSLSPLKNIAIALLCFTAGKPDNPVTVCIEDTLGSDVQALIVVFSIDIENIPISDIHAKINPSFRTSEMTPMTQQVPVTSQPYEVPVGNMPPETLVPGLTQSGKKARLKGSTLRK